MMSEEGLAIIYAILEIDTRSILKKILHNLDMSTETSFIKCGGAELRSYYLRRIV
jgi:hypothetical protein